MVHRFTLVLVVGFVACGCVARRTATIQADTPQGAAGKCTVQGAKGTLTLGDPLAQAKRVFPAPTGAEVFDESLGFAILGEKGWAWQAADNTRSFEVVLRAGKVAAVCITNTVDPKAALAAGERQWGNPSRRAVGKAATAESWDRGHSACMAVLCELPGMGKAGVLLMGPKANLRALSYDPDDPAAFVKQMDLSAAMAKELEPVFREAKRKAMEKAAQRSSR